RPLDRRRRTAKGLVGSMVTTPPQAPDRARPGPTFPSQSLDEQAGPVRNPAIHIHGRESPTSSLPPPPWCGGETTNKPTPSEKTAPAFSARFECAISSNGHKFGPDRRLRPMD